jgi:hypothetical protein
MGAEACHRVLRTGGTAAMVFGQGNTGVCCSSLYAQRSAVGAAASPGGSGDLDLTLVLADGSLRGTADPVHAAHVQPIVKWAEAVWNSWLPFCSLSRICSTAIGRLGCCARPWIRVVGPGLAFVASAQRLGWTVIDADTLIDDEGTRMCLRRDSPAFVGSLVKRAAWRWRWRRVEARHPHLKQGDGGHGPFIQPIFKLLRPVNSEGWGHQQRGGLRSAFLNRQWPQARLRQAGRVDTSACRLCVALGLCDAEERDAQFVGNAVHRVLLCPATEQFRQQVAPCWILRMAQKCRRDGCMLSAVDFDLVTRALAPSPWPRTVQADQSESFQWVLPPTDSDHGRCTLYVDGSRLYAEHGLFDMCARRGWAFAAVNELQEVVAAAQGRPPGWADGIHGAELWGLLQATQSAGLDDGFKVDCLAVRLGVCKGAEWAADPSRRLARAWIPVASAIEGASDRVVWMPAHCSAEALGHKVMSDGSALQAVDVSSNALVDAMAKSVARAQRPPKWQFDLIQREAKRLAEAATWLGQITALANHFPNPTWAEGMPRAGKFLRDSQGERASMRPAGCKPKLAPPALAPPALGDPLAFESSAGACEPIVASQAPRGRAIARAQSVPAHCAVSAARRATAVRDWRHRELLAHEAQVAAWVSSRELKPASGPTAADRRAGLLARLKARGVG